MEKKKKIAWSDKMGKSFENLKIKLTEEPNYNVEFVIQTDMSQKGGGVVLAQR